MKGPTSRHSLAKKLALLLFSLFFLVVIAEFGARIVWYQSHGPDPLCLMNAMDRAVTGWNVRFGPGRTTGWSLSKESWQATFTERGLEPPADGPRDYFRAASPALRKHASIGWLAEEFHDPGRLDIDSRGMQSVGPSDAKRHVLIVGGSVAFGATASRIDTTYFGQLQKLLAPDGGLRISVLAAGAWWSQQEMAAVVQIPADIRPDLVVFLNGLNDLTQNLDIPPERRPAEYARNIAVARDYWLGRGVPVVIAPQPFLGNKAVMSRFERGIMVLPPATRRLLRAYPSLLEKSRKLADHPGTSLLDCSSVFDHETATTFVDFWHFSDPGHALLARRLADGLRPLLAGLSKGEPDPAGGTIH